MIGHIGTPPAPLSFPKNVPRFRAILRPPETAPPCSAGSAGPIVTPLRDAYKIKLRLMEACKEVLVAVLEY